MLEIGSCREPGCDAPAAAGDRFQLPGVDERGRDAWFVHCRWLCARGHHYIVLEDVLPRT